MDSRQKLDEQGGFTSFGGTTDNGALRSGGVMRQFFSKFFSKKGQDELNKDGQEGDTIRTLDVPKQVKAEPDPLSPGYLVSKSSVYLPEIEKNRKQRYQKYEEMDDYPEIGSAFDIYADDTTQKSSTNERWLVKSEHDFVVEEIETMFNTIRLDRFYWDIVRNTCKFGDCFIETIVDINRPKRGIQRIKVLNPNYIMRVEDEFGYLRQFLQEIPSRNSTDNQGWTDSDFDSNSKFIKLDKNQIIHFRLYTSDPTFYPYGKSVAANAVRVFRSLRLMEDAMLIYRLTRAPERRIFYIDVANLPTAKVETFIERIKEKFKKEKFYNSNTGNVDARYNPLSADEDFFVPHRNNKGTKIETLPGAQNLGEVDDVKYFRDKLLASMKIPKDYVVEKDKSPERKANLSQLDAKFARVITRIQKNIEVGMETLAKRHLELMGLPKKYLKGLRIELPDPSDIFAKRRMELEQIKAGVVQQVVATQLFPKRYLYETFYNLSEQEIAEIEKELEKETQKGMQLQQQQSMMTQPGAAGGGLGIGPDAAGVTPPATPPLTPELDGSQAETPQQPQESSSYDELLTLVEKIERDMIEEQ